MKICFKKNTVWNVHYTSDSKENLCKHVSQCNSFFNIFFCIIDWLSKLMREHLNWVWKINEGNIKFLCIMKLIPPKDIRNIVDPNTIH